MKNVTIYEWPENQICMDCNHGINIGSFDNRISSPTYLCYKNSSKSNGITCEDKES